jgi:hypothetical protein
MDVVNYLRLESIGAELGLLGSTLFLLLLIAILIITGLALYKAARLNDSMWFWVIFIINSAGILPLIYLYIKRKEKPHYLWRGRK